jgi:hypothetical protein
MVSTIQPIGDGKPGSVGVAWQGRDVERLEFSEATDPFGRIAVVGDHRRRLQTRGYGCDYPLKRTQIPLSEGIEFGRSG